MMPYATSWSGGWSERPGGSQSINSCLVEAVVVPVGGQMVHARRRRRSELSADGFRDHDGRHVRRCRDDIRHDRRIDDVQAIHSTYRAHRIDDGALVVARLPSERTRSGENIRRPTRSPPPPARRRPVTSLPGVISQFDHVAERRRSSDFAREPHGFHHSAQIASVLEEVEADERHRARVAARQAD